MKSACSARAALARPLAQPLVVRRVAPTPRTCTKATSDAAPVVDTDRLRLNNLSPSAGARKKKTRKGRGMAAGQGGHCGFGMRGQKSRAGSGPRPGFEGGQTSLFRRLPKLRGIAGGMPRGRDKHVTVNLTDLAARFQDGETVDLAQLEGRSVFKVQGAERFLGLKVLGEGALPFPLTIRAHAFSDGAVEKIKEAGGSVEVEPPARIKWTRAGHAARLKAGGGKAPKKVKAGGDRGRPRKPWDKKDEAGNALPNAGREATKHPTGHKKAHTKKLKPWMLIRNEKLKEQGVKLPSPVAKGAPKLSAHGGKQSQAKNVAPKKKRTNQVQKKRVKINKHRMSKHKR